MKVGRSALDEEAIRRIEAQNPDLEFDWPKILKGGGAPPTEPRPPFEARRPRSGVRPRSQDAPPPRDVRGLTPETPPATPPEPPLTPDWGQTPDKNAAEGAEAAGLSPEALPADGTAAHAKLGQDGVQRLRQRYADVRARILERVADPARRAELTASAERLNPDAWTTPEEVATGLEQYESVLASLREVAGRKRRRRRRGSGRRQEGTTGDAQQPASGGSTADSAETADAADAETDEDEEGDADDDPGDLGSGGS